MIWCWLLWLTAALAGPRTLPAGAVDEAQARALFQGRRLALVIGPAAFSDPGFTPLRYTDDDALALSSLLMDPEVGRFDQVFTLTSPAETTLAGVRAAMTELTRQAPSPDDTVFVYFSTHGTLARDPAGRLGQYLVLSDTRLRDVAGTALSHDEVLRWLEALPSRREVLLLATCHSGQGKSVFSAEMQAEVASTKGLPIPPLREVSEAVVMIGVCAWNEPARESEKLGHDIYTWYFMQALTRADADADGAVTVTEAHDHARRHTYAFTQGAQRAYAHAEILGIDPIILAGQRRRVGDPMLASYRAELEGYQVRVDGQIKGTLPGQVTLDPGPHRVELLTPDASRVVAQQRWSFRDGTRLDVDHLLRRDLLRLAFGAGWQAFGEGPASQPIGCTEVHLPRIPGGGWELILNGTASFDWPSTLSGGVAMERPLYPGVIQPRLGLGLQGDLLWTDRPQDLLAPSLVPSPVLALAWLPRHPLLARLSLSGGYLWYTDAATWHNSWTWRATLVMGGSF